MKKIPVFGPIGTQIIDWVFIDDDLYPDLMRHKWIRRKKDSLVFRYVEGDKGPKKSLGHQILGKTPQSEYVIIHKDGNISNYCTENLMAHKRE